VAGDAQRGQDGTEHGEAVRPDGISVIGAVSEVFQGSQASRPDPALGTASGTQGPEQDEG
jgi:type IV secretory pathway TrbL component